MLKRYLYILACLLCFNSMAQTVDSAKAKSNVKGFWLIKVGVNVLPSLSYDIAENSLTTDKKELLEYSRNFQTSLTGGVFFTKRSSAELSAIYSGPTFCKYNSANTGFGVKELSQPGSFYATLNYGYKLPLGKKGHFALKGGFVTGITSVTEIMSYSWGQNSASSHETYKKGGVVGFNTGAMLGFVLSKRTRFSIDCMYTYAVYYPTEIQTSSSYHHHQGAGYFIDGEGNYVYTYKPFSGPKIPINMLSVNVGLSWNF